MEMTNDQVFDFIFREEFEKIPFIFRWRESTRYYISAFQRKMKMK